MIVSALALHLLTCAPSADGDADVATSPSGVDEDASALVATGDDHYAHGDFAEAAAAFARAHDIDPAPATLYRWAQAERRSGNCAVAVQLYRLYLDIDDLDPANADAAEKNMSRCGHVDEVAPKESVSPAPPQRIVDDETPPPDDSWKRDPLAVSLLAVGGAGLVTSAVLGIQGEQRRRRAEAATVEDDYVRHADRARSMAIAAGVIGGISAALVIGGTVRYLLLRKRATGRVTTRFGTLTVRF